MERVDNSTLTGHTEDPSVWLGVIEYGPSDKTVRRDDNIRQLWEDTV